MSCDNLYYNINHEFEKSQILEDNLFFLRMFSSLIVCEIN